MALQKKKYRCSVKRSRGNGTVPQVRPAYAKDYGKQVRAFHGQNTDEVQENLAKQIQRRKKFG